MGTALPLPISVGSRSVDKVGVGEDEALERGLPTPHRTGELFLSNEARGQAHPSTCLPTFHPLSSRDLSLLGLEALPSPPSSCCRATLLPPVFGLGGSVLPAQLPQGLILGLRCGSPPTIVLLNSPSHKSPHPGPWSCASLECRQRSRQPPTQPLLGKYI